jgi:hypothetical protein
MYKKMSEIQEKEQNEQGDSNEMEPPLLTRNSRSFATMMSNTSSTLLGEDITENLSYATLIEKDRNSSRGGCQI